MSRESARELGKELAGLDLSDKVDQAKYYKILDSHTRKVEGYRSTAYNDRNPESSVDTPEGEMTIGWGYNMESFRNPDTNRKEWNKAFKAAGLSTPNYDMVFSGRQSITEEEAIALHNYKINEAATGTMNIYGKILSKLPQELEAPVKMNLVSTYHNPPALVVPGTRIYGALEAYSNTHSAADFKRLTNTIRNTYPRGTEVTKGLINRREETAIMLEAASEELMRNNEELRELEYQKYATGARSNEGETAKNAAITAHSMYYIALQDSPSWRMDGLETDTEAAKWERITSSAAFAKLKGQMKHYLKERNRLEVDLDRPLTRAEYDNGRRGVDAAIMAFSQSVREAGNPHGWAMRMVNKAKNDATRELSEESRKVTEIGNAITANEIHDMTMAVRKYVSIEDSNGADANRARKQFQDARQRYADKAAAKGAFPNDIENAVGEAMSIGRGLHLGQLSGIVSEDVGNHAQGMESAMRGNNAPILVKPRTTTGRRPDQ